MNDIKEIFNTNNIELNKAIVLYKLRNYEIQQRIYHLYETLKEKAGFKGLYLIGSSIEKNNLYFSDVDLNVYTDHKHYIELESYLRNYYENVEQQKENLVHKGELTTFDIHPTTDPRIEKLGVKIEKVSPPKLLFIGKRTVRKERLSNSITEFEKTLSSLKKDANNDYFSQYIYEIFMKLYINYYRILKLLYKYNGYAIPYFEEDAIKLSKKFTTKDFVDAGRFLIKANKDYFLLTDFDEQVERTDAIVKYMLKRLNIKTLENATIPAKQVLKTLKV